MTKETTLLSARPAAMARRRPSSLPVISTQRNIAEAALAVTAAFAAMLLVAAIALVLLGVNPVSSLGLLAALLSLAVGGSLSVGGDSSGGTFSIGIDGSAAVMPLGLTLVGAVVLGLAFYLPLRRWRRLSPGLMTGRFAAAAATCCLILVAAAAVGRGTLNLPSSLTSRLSGGLGGGSALGGMFGGMGSLGGSGTSGLSSLAFSTSPAVFAGLVWVLVVLCVGLLVARPALVPAEVAWSWWRAGAYPALTATIRVISVLLVILVAGGLGLGLALAGSNGLKIIGVVLLLLPNVLIAVVSGGVGVTWSLFAGSTATSGSGGLGSLMMGGLGGLGGGSGGTTQVPSVSRSIGLFEGPLGIGLLLVAAVILLACGVLADAREPLRTRRNGKPAETDGERARRQAVQLGIVWAVGLTVLVLCAGVTGTIQISMMGSPMAGFGAHADASVVVASFAGLLAGGAAGGAGSLLGGKIRRRSGGVAGWPGSLLRGKISRLRFGGAR